MVIRGNGRPRINPNRLPFVNILYLSCFSFSSTSKTVEGRTTRLPTGSEASVRREVVGTDRDLRPVTRGGCGSRISAITEGQQRPGPTEGRVTTKGTGIFSGETGWAE